MKLVLAAALAFCLSPGRAQAAPVLTLPDGKKITVELALTPQAQAAGLMFRESLAADSGMLFCFPEDSTRTFWMKNTFISLDIIFLDGDMKIRNIFHNVPRSDRDQPEEEVARVSGRARFVLELAAGRARKAGLKPGSRLKSSVDLSRKAGPVGAASKKP